MIVGKLLPSVSKEVIQENINTENGANTAIQENIDVENEKQDPINKLFSLF